MPRVNLRRHIAPNSVEGRPVSCRGGNGKIRYAALDSTFAKHVSQFGFTRAWRTKQDHILPGFQRGNRLNGRSLKAHERNLRESSQYSIQETVPIQTIVLSIRRRGLWNFRFHSFGVLSGFFRQHCSHRLNQWGLEARRRHWSCGIPSVEIHIL